MSSGEERAGPAGTRAFGDPAQILSRQHSLREGREGDAADAEFPERVEQLSLDPTVEHRVRRLVDQEWRPRSRRIAAASRVFSAEYDEIPAYSALPARTAESSAPIVSSSGVSGSKRCE